MVILLCRDLVKRGSAQNGIAEDIKFLLTGEDALFHRGQALVKAAGGLLVQVHDGAVPVDPGAAVQGAGRKLLHQHGGGEAAVLHSDLMALAALEAPGNVVGGRAEDHHRAPAQLRRLGQGVVH